MWEKEQLQGRLSAVPLLVAGELSDIILALIFNHRVFSGQEVTRETWPAPLDETQLRLSWLRLARDTLVICLRPTRVADEATVSRTLVALFADVHLAMAVRDHTRLPQ